MHIGARKLKDAKQARSIISHTRIVLRPETMKHLSEEMQTEMTDLT